MSTASPLSTTCCFCVLKLKNSISSSALDGWGESRRWRFAKKRGRTAAANFRRGSEGGVETSAAPAAEPILCSQGEMQKKTCLPEAQACMRMFSNLRKRSCLSYCVHLLCTVAVWSICMCLAALGIEGASNQAGGSLCGLVVLSHTSAKKRVCSRGETLAVCPLNDKVVFFIVVLV